METFEITIGNITYTVTVYEEETYLIETDIESFTIVPEVEDNGVVWKIIE